MPPYQSFLSGSNATQFWEFVKWLLFYVAPIVMIMAAVYVVYLIIIHVLPAIFGKNRVDEEDKDYEEYRY